MRVLTLAAALTAASVLLSTQSPVSRSPLWFDLEAGPHAVGFKVEYLVDSTRSVFSDDDTGGGRPIRVLIWYPASASNTPPLRFGDYLDLSIAAGSETYGRFLRSRDSSTAVRQFMPESDSLLGVLRGTRTFATPSAAPAAGRFPLVLHSLGRNDYQLESTVLWEYLASHGYVVAVVPQVGPNAASPGLGFRLPDLEVQVEDLRFARARLARWSRVEPERAAVIGHSSGAITAALLARGPQPPAAVVSLDGSIATADGRELLRAAGWDAAPVSAPILNLYRAGSPREDLWSVDGWGADRYDVRLGADRPLQATHFDFQNWPLYAALTGVTDVRGERSRGVAVGRDFFLAVCRLTRRFLDGAVGGDTAALGYVRGDLGTAGLDSAVARFDYRPAGR